MKRYIAEGLTSNNNNDDKMCVVDARSAARFTAQMEEPRPGYRGGHMPGSNNLPFVELLDPSNPNRYKSPTELQSILKAAGIPLPLQASRRIISTCGSGVTAASLLVVLTILGEPADDHAYLYDGAWMEWGAQADTLIVTGSDDDFDDK